MVVSQAENHASFVKNAIADLSLSGDEMTWLSDLKKSPGFQVTCRIQRFWRLTKLRATAVLTLAAVKDSEELLQNYIDQTPCTSLFFITEAVGFLDYIAARSATDPHVADVAAFERALLLARNQSMSCARSDSAGVSRRSFQRIKVAPGAALVEFSAPPEVLLGALLAGALLPEAQSERYPILVAPGLERIWRPATRDEQRIFEACRRGASLDEPVLNARDGMRILDELLRVGALSLAS